MLKTWIKLAGKIITIFSLLFIGIAIAKLDIDLSYIKSPFIFAFIFIISSIAIMGAEYILGYAWKKTLDTFSNKTNSIIATEKVYLKANIGKYLPGNVMHYVERNLFAFNLGIKQQEVLLSTLVEILGILLMAIFISVLFAFQKFQTVIIAVFQEISHWWIILVSILFFILLFLVLLLKKHILKIFKAYVNIRFFKTLLIILPLYASFLLIGAVTFSLTLWCMLPHTLIQSNLYLILMAYVLAWVLGFAVPGAPGGVGVREFVLLYLLKDIFPNDIVLTAVLVHRLITIIGDFEAYFSVLFIKRVPLNHP